jgi:mannose-6-phosphate isomerase-like protein (cupin superfamily)
LPIIDVTDLPASRIAHELEGARFDGLPLSLILVDAAPGAGPSLHKHPYEEVFVIQEGEATFTLGNEQLTATAGQVVIVPPDTPHRFVNSGDGRLRQVDIHASGAFETEWL